jgi:predicted metal-dependent hydrolase
VTTATAIPHVRRVAFDLPDDLDLCWSGHVPEFACAANSVSLLMPHVEPYVAKSVRSVLDRLADPALRAGAEAYVRQELAHHAQHHLLDARLLAEVRGLATLDRAMRAVFARLARRRRIGTHLAFAAGSETVAYSAARWAAAHRRELLSGADPRVADIFVWHLAEEVEHKTVAYDVFHAIDGSRRRFLWGMVQALLVLAVFTVLGTTVQLWHRRRLFHPVAIFRLVRWNVTFLFELLPAMAVALVPGHHPRDLVDPPFLVQWLREHDATATG